MARFPRSRSPVVSRLALLGGLAWILAVEAHAQSFNIDLEVGFGPPTIGAGAPSSAFGAAANQPGYWNLNAATGQPPQTMRDLLGQLTGVTLFSPDGGGGHGFFNPANTGDFALLLNDGRIVGLDTWTFTGLVNGMYQVFTYSVWPSGRLTDTRVTVTGSANNPQFVSGPMPGNAFAVGITHCTHDAIVTDGTLAITVERGQLNNAYVNGFQLVAVPEPGTLLGLSSWILLLRLRRKRT